MVCGLSLIASLVEQETSFQYCDLRIISMVGFIFYHTVDFRA